MSYRPICDVWLLARSKVKYYGALPAGSLIRMRDLLGVGLRDPILHVCSGRIRQYPYRGLGQYDQLLDLDPNLTPDFLQDARDPFPPFAFEFNHDHRLRGKDPKKEVGWRAVKRVVDGWPGILCDSPYSIDDALKYTVGRDALAEAMKKNPRKKKFDADDVKLPSARRLLLNGLDAVRVGGRVGILHYIAPKMPRDRARFVACVTVFVGFENRPRLYSVYERLR